MNITVYLGANDGTETIYKTAAAELGRWIGKNGHTLIYGGSKCGLMGVLAENVLLAGGKVIGVEPDFFVDAGYVYDDISQLIVTKTMAERKSKMIELGDAQQGKEVFALLGNNSPQNEGSNKRIKEGSAIPITDFFDILNA